MAIKDFITKGNAQMAGHITVNGYIAGPANFIIDPAGVGDNTGTVVIAGDLQVDGTQTTVNSTTLDVSDLNITVAKGAVNSAAANGAGLTVDGASATLTYSNIGDKFVFNKPLDVTGNIGVTGTVDGVDIAVRDAVLTSTTTTAGAALPKAGGTITGTLNIDVADLFVKDTTGGAQGQVQIGAGTAQGFINIQKGDGTRNVQLSSDGDTYFNGGNVGIGTDTPGSELHVHSAAPGLRLTSSSDSGTPTAQFDYSPGSGYFLRLGDSANNEDVMIRSYGDSVFNGGNVGIGTDTPGEKLVVAGDGARMTVESADMEVAMLGRRGSSGAALDDGYLRLRKAGVTADGIVLNTGGSSWLNGGNVGIGTASPGYKLEVSGTAHVTATLSAGALSIPSQGIILNQAFGTGVPSITMTGTANNGRAGAINFKESDGSGGAIANTAAIYSTDGAGGNANYGGLTIAAYQSDIRFSTGSLAGTKMIVQAGGNVGIGTTNPQKLLQVKETSTATTSVHYPITVGGANHVANYAAGIGFDPEGYGNRNKVAIVAEGIGQGYSRGKLHFLLNGLSNSDEATLADSKLTIQENGDVNAVGYLSSKKGTIQTVVNQATIYTSINPVQVWAEASSSYRVSITPKFASGTKIFGTFSIPINPTGAANILMSIQPWYSTDGGTTKTVLNQGGPAGSRITGSHAWFRSSNGYDGNDMQNHIVHFAHSPGATTTMTWGFYFRSEGSNTTYFCYSSGNSGLWGWTAPVYMELREVEVA